MLAGTQIGCNPNIIGSQGLLVPPCTTKMQLLALRNITLALSQADENDIFEKTGMTLHLFPSQVTLCVKKMMLQKEEIICVEKFNWWWEETGTIMMSGCLSPCEKDHFAITAGAPSCQEDKRFANYKLIKHQRIDDGNEQLSKFRLCIGLLREKLLWPIASLTL